MPTKNRRVATYLPPYIEERFLGFKGERMLGDSEALAVILSEYFEMPMTSGVSQEVAYLSSSNLPQRVETLESKLDELTRILTKRLQELSDAMTSSEPESNSNGESLNEFISTEIYAPSPGQIELLQADSDSTSSILSELLNQDTNNFLDKPRGELEPMNGYSLSNRFGLNQQVVGNSKNKWKDRPEKFAEWSKQKDPDGIAWQYDPVDKLYHPNVFSEPSDY